MSKDSRPVAIITGPGSGIGRALSLMLAGEGYRLALVGRTESKLQETSQLIAQKSDDAPDVLVVVADVGAADQDAKIIEQTLGRFGQVDVLVNNAGCAPLRPLEDLDDALIEEVFPVNLFGPMRLTAALMTHFRGRGGGCVVNISSIATVDPFPGLSVYAAAKSGLESLTRSIHNEAAEEGIPGVRAYSIAPGAVETAMLRGIVSKEDLPPENTLSPEMVAQVALDCILGRREADRGKTIVMESP